MTRNDICVKRHKCPADIVKTDTMKIQLFSNRNSPQIPPKIKKYKN